MKQSKKVLFASLALLCTISLSCKKEDNSKNGPSISGISPSSVLTGDLISIKGKKLSNASVEIGGIAVTPEENTASLITATIPRGATIGDQVVIVETSEGKTTSKIFVTGKGAGPVITSVTPNPASVGENITILGTGLANCAVYIYKKQATIISNTATTIKVTVPAGIPKGSAAVSVLTSLGDTVTSIKIN